MFTAPPLAPEVKRRGRLFRALSVLGLGTAAVVLLVANLVLHFVCYFAIDPPASPRELYHNTWQAVKDNIYDQDRLRNWDAWEHKYDHQIETHEDAIRYASELVGSLGDRYTFLLDPSRVEADKQRADGHFIGIGITLGGRVDADGKLLSGETDGYPVVKQVYRGSPAQAAGLRAGQAIVSIDGRLTTGLNPDEVAGLLRGQAGQQVTLVVRSGNTDVTLTVVRGPVNIPIVSTKRLANGIGYIRLEAFDQWDTGEEMRQALEDLSDCRALVIDVRDNPGGFIHSALYVSALFLDQGVITTERQRIPQGGYLTLRYRVTHGAFAVDVSAGPIKNLPLKAPIRPPNLAGQRPVVLLVNGGTASASELFTAALQDNGRATVVGTRTFGKGIGQTYVPVGQGARLRITNIHGFTPNGRFIGDGGNTTAFGITPDQVVEPAGDLTFGEPGDNQLDFAIEFLKEKLAH
jgi:carboxyl-terminal processing protease